MDLTTRPGAAIQAPTGGTVHFAGVIAGRPVLSIAHGNGFISSFEPAVSNTPRGRPVRQGQNVGQVATGPTHCSASATCLHWGVRKNGVYINPLLLVPGARGPAILLPMLGR